MGIIGSVLGSVASTVVGGVLGGGKKKSSQQPFQRSVGSGLGDLKTGIMSLPERRQDSKPAEVEDPKVFMEYADIIRNFSPKR